MWMETRSATSSIRPDRPACRRESRFVTLLLRNISMPLGPTMQSLARSEFYSSLHSHSTQAERRYTAR